MLVYSANPQTNSLDEAIAIIEEGTVTEGSLCGVVDDYWVILDQ